MVKLHHGGLRFFCMARFNVVGIERVLGGVLVFERDTLIDVFLAGGYRVQGGLGMFL